jgi:hypothetical protein
MKRRAWFSAIGVVFAFLLGITACSQKQESPAPPKAAPQTINMQDGQWEITTSLEMPGMPAGMMKPQTFTTCLSQRDSVPKGGDQSDCTIKDAKTDGNTVTWAVACKDSTGKGRVTYAGSSFDGIIETTTKEDGKEITAKMTMKGRHLGPCPK